MKHTLLSLSMVFIGLITPHLTVCMDQGHKRRRSLTDDYDMSLDDQVSANKRARWAEGMVLQDDIAILGAQELAIDDMDIEPAQVTQMQEAELVQWIEANMPARIQDPVIWMRDRAERLPMDSSDRMWLCDIPVMEDDLLTHVLRTYPDGLDLPRLRVHIEIGGAHVFITPASYVEIYDRANCRLRVEVR